MLQHAKKQSLTERLPYEDSQGSEFLTGDQWQFHEHEQWSFMFHN